jgi:hypothetical protein
MNANSSGRDCLVQQNAFISIRCEFEPEPDKPRLSHEW